MAVGLLLVTHNQIGRDLLDTAASMLGGVPLPHDALEVRQGGDPDVLREQAASLRAALDEGDGVLVLTDMFGSTPSNIAVDLLQHPQCEVITGLSLPMLIRVLNYPGLGLQELVNKALSGGHDGILLCERED
jgi:PTS system ascorbate-specific IIA component